MHASKIIVVLKQSFTDDCSFCYLKEQNKLNRKVSRQKTKLALVKNGSKVSLFFKI